MCVAIATNLPPVFLTTFAETFGGAAGLTEEQLGRISALVFAGFMAGIAFTGPLADHWGAKRFVLGGLTAIGSGLALLGVARSYAMLLASVFFMGLGAGMLEVVLSPVVAALQPHRRAAALNWMHSFYCLGAVCTVLAGSAGLYYQVPWRAVALCIMAMPMSIFLGFMPMATPPMVHEDANREPLRALLRHRHLFATIALIGLGGATELGIVQWLPTYAERGFGYPKSSAGIFLVAFSVLMILGRILAGFIVRHWRPATLMLACCALSAVAIPVASLIHFAPMSLTLFILVGAPVSCFWPTALALAADRFPRAGASLYAVLSIIGNLGCMIMPWWVGLIAARTSLSLGLTTVTIAPLAMLAILVGLGLRQKKCTPAPDR